MTRNAFSFLAALSLIFTVSAAAPSLARAEAPVGWLITCDFGDELALFGPIFTDSPQGISDAIALCHEVDAGVGSVEPIF